jgi:hypothetical protein
LFHTKPKTAYALSTIIATLMVVACTGGFLLEDLYRDNAFATLAWRSTDLATLVVAVPVLIASMILSLRGFMWAQLVWLGMIGYALYNYAYYLFGAAFNSFFLIYVALFTLSMFALIFALVNVDVHEIARKYRDKTPAKWISGYMIFVAAGIGGLWIAQSLSFVATGKVPPFIETVDHPTSVVFALDLSLVVPFLVLGAVWLRQRRPWGYVLAGILNVKGAVYMLALFVASLSAVRAGFSAGPADLILWGLLGLGFLAMSLLLLSSAGSAGGEGAKRGDRYYA